MTPHSNWAGNTYAVNFTVEGHAGKYSSYITFTTKEQPDMRMVRASMVPGLADSFGVTPNRVRLEPIVLLARETLQ
jgi:hypothetical protein